MPSAVTPIVQPQSNNNDAMTMQMIALMMQSAMGSQRDRTQAQSALQQIQAKGALESSLQDKKYGHALDVQKISFANEQALEKIKHDNELKELTQAHTLERALADDKLRNQWIEKLYNEVELDTTDTTRLDAEALGSLQYITSTVDARLATLRAAVGMSAKEKSAKDTEKAIDSVGTATTQPATGPAAVNAAASKAQSSIKSTEEDLAEFFRAQQKSVGDSFAIDNSIADVAVPLGEKAADRFMARVRGAETYPSTDTMHDWFIQEVSAVQGLGASTDILRGAFSGAIRGDVVTLTPTRTNELIKAMGGERKMTELRLVLNSAQQKLAKELPAYEEQSLQLGSNKQTYPYNSEKLVSHDSSKNFLTRVDRADTTIGMLFGGRSIDKNSAMLGTLDKVMTTDGSSLINYKELETMANELASLPRFQEIVPQMLNESRDEMGLPKLTTTEESQLVEKIRQSASMSPNAQSLARTNAVVGEYADEGRSEIRKLKSEYFQLHQRADFIQNVGKDMEQLELLKTQFGENPKFREVLKLKQQKILAMEAAIQGQPLPEGTPVAYSTYGKALSDDVTKFFTDMELKFTESEKAAAETRNQETAKRFWELSKQMQQAQQAQTAQPAQPAAKAPAAAQPRPQMPSMPSAMPQAPTGPQGPAGPAGPQPSSNPMFQPTGG